MVLSGLVVVLAFASTPAFARGGDDAEVTRMAKEHYKSGLEAYEAGNYPTAIKELKKAYLLKRLPALLLNIGATYRKMNDNDNAISYYKKYLTEAPEARDRGEVEKIVSELHPAAPRPRVRAPSPAGRTRPSTRRRRTRRWTCASACR
jgi:tetratricopeptide (TPR) repeat protein